jgi:hypothetical protein
LLNLGYAYTVRTDQIPKEATNGSCRNLAK